MKSGSRPYESPACNWTFDKTLDIKCEFVNLYSTTNSFSRQMRELTWGLGSLEFLPKPQVNSPKNLISRCSVEYKILLPTIMSMKLSKIQNEPRSRQSALTLCYAACYSFLYDIASSITCSLSSSPFLISHSQMLITYQP